MICVYKFHYGILQVLVHHLYNNIFYNQEKEMQFIVTGSDGKDEKALERRLAAREEHLQLASKMHGDGKWLYAAAILSDDGVMCGSVIVCEFPSREALKKEWLDQEPYIKENVWEKVEVMRAQVAPFCAPK